MKGKLYCAGVGPGDPELLTLKALRIIQHCPVLAVPRAKNGGTLTADSILQKALADNGIVLKEKKTLLMDFPMTREKKVLAAAHEKAAAAITACLDQGEDVCLITLGCPTVYATSIYVHRLVQKQGYDTSIVPGVPSFCAVAAKLQQPLCEKNEPLLIIPASNSQRRQLLALPGSKVIMKPEGKLAPLKEELAELGLLDKTSMIERCGLPGEKVYPKAAKAEETGYFAVLLVKE